MKNYINVSAIDVDFVMKVLIITLFSWVPLHVAKWVRVKIDPSEEDKLKRAKLMLKQQERMLEELNFDREPRENKLEKIVIDKADKEEKEEKEEKEGKEGKEGKDGLVL